MVSEEGAWLDPEPLHVMAVARRAAKAIDLVHGRRNNLHYQQHEPKVLSDKVHQSSTAHGQVKAHHASKERSSGYSDLEMCLCAF